MANKVIFSGDTKLIIIKSGVTTIDVGIDLYSDWKEWVLESNNSKWASAFRTTGGDPTSETQFSPAYYFLLNGWKVYAEDVEVVIQLNLYSDDGLSPFIIDNSAITNRGSDVPIVKSKLEQRLTYGDRIYYDENSSYFGVIYPYGTIAQPINNPQDAETIATVYGITQFYALSDVTLLNQSTTWSNFSVVAVNANLIANLSITGITLDNMVWTGFIIDGHFDGGNVKLENCVIENALYLSGEIKDSQINGTIIVNTDLVVSSCYSGIAGEGISIFDMYSGNTTSLSLRAYSGGVDLRNVDTSGCTTTIELIAGQIRLDSTCTAGYIDLRGVGYITDNSNGSTIKTTGFIDSFEEYVEETREINELLAYDGKIYLDDINGFTGTTYPVGTIASPVNNLDDLLTLAAQINTKDLYLFNSFIIVDESGNTIGITQNFNEFNIYPVRDDLQITVNSGEPGIISGSRVIRFHHLNSDYKNELVSFNNCIVENFQNLNGSMSNCTLQGTLSISSDSILDNCLGGTIDPIITLADSGITVLFREYSGNIIIDSMTNDDDRIEIDLIAGRIEVTSGCTNGIIDVRGVGHITDNSLSGCTVIVNALSNESITDAVWNEPILDHTDAGSTGNALYNVSASANPNIIANAVWNAALSGFTIDGSAGAILNSSTGMTSDIKRILGLTQENFRIVNHVYDSTSNTLQSATIKIYETSTDCENDTNNFASYDMTAVYDDSNRLIDYKVTKN